MKQLREYFGVSVKVALNEQMIFRTNFWLGIMYVCIRVFLLLALWSA